MVEAVAVILQQGIIPLGGRQPRELRDGQIQGDEEEEPDGDEVRDGDIQVLRG